MPNERLSVAPTTSALYGTISEQGACRNEEPNTFFYDEGMKGLRKLERKRAAQAICSTCVVQSQCLEYSVLSVEEYGVWGGVDEDERKKLRSRRMLEKQKNQKLVF